MMPLPVGVSVAIRKRSNGSDLRVTSSSSAAPPASQTAVRRQELHQQVPGHFYEAATRGLSVYFLYVDAVGIVETATDRCCAE
jgi:hypothetical protein